MAHVARRHHYLPQGYLAAFTDSGCKDGKFHVVNVAAGTSFRTSPINVAAERDFKRVDVEGYPPDAIETALSPIEDRAVQAIRSAIGSQTFPGSDGHNLILNLLALIAVQNPRRRTIFNHAREQSTHRILEQLVSSPETWEHHLAKARADGVDVSSSVPFAKAKRFVDERRYRLSFSTDESLRVEFDALDNLLPLLGQRTWTLMIAPAGGPEFICSDHPVTLVSKRGGTGSIGFASRASEVFFPLGRTAGFYGTFEEPVEPVLRLRPYAVAVMNRRVATNALRHLYSALPGFYISHRGQPCEVRV